MSEMTTETEVSLARTPSPEMLPGDVIFVEDAITEVGHAIGRFMDPTPVAGELLDPENVASDEKIAKILSRVKDDSPKIDPTTEQGIVKATESMVGRLDAVIEQATDPKVKKELEKFKNKNVRKSASFLTKNVAIGRRNFIKVAAAFGLAAILASCGPSVVGPVVVPGDGGGTGAASTEVAPPIMVPTEVTPTTRPTETPTVTPTATPTEAPTPTEIPVQVGLPEKFEDIQVINEEDLDTFMPRLLAAEKEYISQHPEKFQYQKIIFGPQTDWERKSPSQAYEPYNVWALSTVNFAPDAGAKNLPDQISSVSLVKMKDGSELYMIGVPGTLFYGGRANSQLESGQVIFHFLYNPAAVEKYRAATSSQSSYEEYESPSAVFQRIKNGSNNISVELFIDSTNQNKEVINSFGWQASGTLLEKNDHDFDFSRKLKEWVYKSISPSPDYISNIQSALLPVWLIFT